MFNPTLPHIILVVVITFSFCIISFISSCILLYFILNFTHIKHVIAIYFIISIIISVSLLFIFGNNFLGYASGIIYLLFASELAFIVKT